MPVTRGGRAHAHISHRHTATPDSAAFIRLSHSAIGLTLRVSNKTTGEPTYSIDPDSVQTIYLGFK